MRYWLIKKLGGYPDIDSAIEAIKEKDSKQKYEILTLAVKRLFNTIGPGDILSENQSHQWMYEGKILTDGQVKNIRTEAEQIANTFTWKILQADIKYKANRQMFFDSNNVQSLASGKLWLYTLNVFNNRIKSIIDGIGTLKEN